jgi:hypothetical protein
MDEYIASLPAQAAFIGGKTLETLTSLPPVPQPKGQGANNGINNTGINNAGGVGIGINTIGRTGFNAIGGMGGGANTLGGAGIGINKPSIAADATYNTIGAANLYDDKDKVVEDDVDENDTTDEADKAADKEDRADKAPGELSPEERSVVNELRNRDREVKAHEQAHVSAGGAYIRGGPSYQYQRGPDNKSYAVGGEVGIDTAPERDDPGATITKMQAVRSAALAPNDPSAQDRAVASAAARQESLSRADLAAEARNADES